MDSNEPDSTQRRNLLGAALAGTLAVATPSRAAVAPAPARRFNGKVVLITGATSGIGRAAALAFASEGAKVAFCGRRENLGAEVEKLIRDKGGEALYVRADVRQEEDVKNFVAATVQKFGRLDVAFNNAGISIEKPLHEYTAAEWDDVHHTNVRGVFLAMKYELPHMVAAGKGNIVVTSSTQAITTTENRSAYGSSKRALVGMVQAAAFDYADKGVRINALLPGTTNTPLVRALAGMNGMPDFAWNMGASHWAKSHVPGLKRMATAEEIAAVALMLASDDYPYFLGSAIVVDGGQSSHTS